MDTLGPGVITRRMEVKLGKDWIELCAIKGGISCLTVPNAHMWKLLARIVVCFYWIPVHNKVGERKTDSLLIRGGYKGRTSIK